MDIVSSSLSGILDAGVRRERIMQALVTDIIQGRFSTGQRLVTEELAVRFHVSHTPIREALIALAGMGLIELIPHRGAKIRKITTREVRDISQVQHALECEAVRSACGRVPQKRLELMQKKIEALKSEATSGQVPDVTEFIARAGVLDAELHDLIAQSSGNSYLAQELNRNKLLFRVLREAAWQRETPAQGFDRMVVECDEHHEITNELLKNDRRAATQAMSRHIREGMRYWCNVLPSDASAPDASAVETTIDRPTPLPTSDTQAE